MPAVPAMLAGAPAWFRRRRGAALLAAAVIVVGVALAVAMGSGHDRGSVNSPAAPTDSTPTTAATARPVVTAPATTQVSIQVQVPPVVQPGGGKGRGKHHGGHG
jgi:hypothetical protein